MFERKDSLWGSIVFALMFAFATPFVTESLYAGVTINTEPVSIEANAGDRVEFSVGATGTSLRYQWYKNGIRLNGKTSRRLILSSVDFDDSATYHVRIRDNRNDTEWSGPGILNVSTTSGGTINICNATLDSGSRRVAVSHPETGKLLNGREWFAQPYVGNDIENLAPTGAAVPFYESDIGTGIWFKTPNPIRKINGVAPGQEVLVQFRVWEWGKGKTFEEALENDSDFFASNIFEYTTGGAGSPPSIAPSVNGLQEFFFNSGLPITEATILSQSTHKFYSEGETVLIEVEADGPGLTYNWYVNGMPSDVSDTGSILFENATAANSGTYQLEVVDENGKSAISEPIITVVLPFTGGTFNFCNIGLDSGQRNVPVIHPESGGVSGIEWLAQPYVGEDAYNMLPVGPPSPFFTGEAAGLIVKSPTPTRKATHVEPGTVATMQIRVWQSGKGGSFESAVENGSDFFASNIFEVALGGVGTPPSIPTNINALEEFFFNDGLPIEEATILGQSDHISILEGSPLELNVEAVGLGLSYQWFFNGSLIENSNSESYSIANSNESHSGTYHVIVTDENENTAVSSPIVAMVSPISGGSFIFCNVGLDGGTRNVPVVHPETGGVEGMEWLAQPWVGNNAYDLKPVGPATPFFNGEAAGLILKSPNPTRKASHIAPGTLATIQIRVWQARKGSDFESALENESDFFASNIFTKTLGGIGNPPSVPTFIDELEEFNFNGGLPSPEVSIVSQSSHQSLSEGQALNIEVEAVGPGLVYKWYFNGLPVTDATTGLISIQSVVEANQGTYQVFVTDENGKVAVSEPIIVIVNPSSGGTFNFCNIGLDGGQRNVPVTHEQMVISGTDWFAQPFVGNTTNDLEPVGPPVPFYTGDAAGLILKNPTPTRRAKNVEPGSVATIQIRVWRSGKGADFESALNNESDYFASNIFTATLGGAGNPPTFPVEINGLNKFFFNEGLPPEVAEIVNQPTHTSLTVGNPLSLVVDAKGDGLKYEWFLNGVALANSNSSSFDVASANESDQGTYHVVVTDENDNSASSEPIVVLISPTQGGSFVFCNVGFDGGTRNVPVEHPDSGGVTGANWLAQPFVGTNKYDLKPVGPATPFFDGEAAGLIIKSPNPTRKASHLDPGVEAVFQIRVWQSGKGIDFESALANGSEFFASNIFTEVLGGAGSPPSIPVDIDGLEEFYFNEGLPPAEAVILEQPKHILINEGEKTTLTVVADGPGLSYQWYFNGHPIDDANGPEIGSEMATLDMQGTYDVVVSDENGNEVLSEPAIVNILPLARGATLNICNIEIGPERRQVPVEHPEDGPLTGRAWLAQPFIGTSPFDLKPVGPAVPFYGEGSIGIYRKEITPIRTFSHITPGDIATVQIRVWESAFAPEFFEAIDKGSNYFASNIFEQKTGGAGSPPSFPPTLEGLQKFSLNEGLPDINVFWPTPANITYGTPLGDDQLNAQTTTPGSFVYEPAAGTILNAGVHKLKAKFTPDSDEFEPIDISVNITVEKAVPQLVGNPTSNWPTDTPLDAYLFSGIQADTPGSFQARLNGSTQIHYGITMIRSGANSVAATFVPDDSDNFAQVNFNFQITGLKPKKEEVRPKNTEVTEDSIKIELPVEPNTYYQIEMTEDFINWEVVFVSNDDESAEFKAALDETKAQGFFRIRSYQK